MSGLNGSMKILAVGLAVLATLAQLLGVILVVRGITDDEDTAQRINRIPLRPPPNLQHLYTGPQSRALANFQRGQMQILQQEITYLLKGSSRQRRFGVVLLLLGIVLGFAASMVALLG